MSSSSNPFWKDDEIVVDHPSIPHHTVGTSLSDEGMQAPSLVRPLHPGRRRGGHRSQRTCWSASAKGLPRSSLMPCMERPGVPARICWQTWRSCELWIGTGMCSVRCNMVKKTEQFDKFSDLAVGKKQPRGSEACVWNIWIDEKLLTLWPWFETLILEFWFWTLSQQGGNLMFAADCPTKRAAFMTDMTLGRWSHVPAISILSSMATG